MATLLCQVANIAGAYSMNFKFMPKWEWRWSYFNVLGVMAGLAFRMVIYCKRKKWM